MELRLRELLGCVAGPMTFNKLPHSVYVLAADVLTRKAKVWGTFDTPEDSIAAAVRASCSIPFFFQPVGGRYIDGGVLSNLPAYLFSLQGRRRPASSRILAFTLRADDYSSIDLKASEFYGAVANTIVDGAQDIQSRLINKLHIIESNTGSVKATDFDKVDSEVIDTLLRNGKDAAVSFFNDEMLRASNSSSGALALHDDDELLAILTRTLDSLPRDVYVLFQNTDFVYSIFPTILLWRMRGVNVTAVLPRIESDPARGRYRRNLLTKLGCLVVEVDELPFVGVLVDAARLDGIAAAACQKHQHHDNRYSVYSGEAHIAVRRALLDRCVEVVPEGAQPQYIPKVVRADTSFLICRLKEVSQYRKQSVTLTLEAVSLKQVKSLAEYIREYKYNQVESWVKLYQSAGLQLFETAAVVLSDDALSYITPPVLEEVNGSFYLLEGTTRATYLNESGEDRIHCVVVRNVADRLPSTTTVDLPRVRVLDQQYTPQSRYVGFDYADFRHIEVAVRPISS